MEKHWWEPTAIFFVWGSILAKTNAPRCQVLFQPKMTFYDVCGRNIQLLPIFPIVMFQNAATLLIEAMSALGK